VSQLGYMFLAIGSGAYVAAIFLMVVHAFFKALLFLGSGSVIHGMHDEQDMRRMGALRKVMPITAATFIVGWLAIAGVPPLAGFWAKDEVLLFALAKSPKRGGRRSPRSTARMASSSRTSRRPRCCSRSWCWRSCRSLGV
jgi:NADH-quinone oxidoreductase subunit L